MRVAMSGDGIRVDNTCATSGDHGPDASFGIQDGELQGGTSRSIKFLNVGFLLSQIAAERSRPNLN